MYENTKKWTVMLIYAILTASDTGNNGLNITGTLYPYKENHCSRGFMNLDRFIYKGVAVMEKENADTEIYIKFSNEKDHTTQTYCQILPLSCSSLNSAVCDCATTHDKNSFEYTAYFNASDNLSNRKITAYFHTSDFRIISHTENIPEIHDPRTNYTAVTVNGQSLSSLCNKTINNDELKVEAICHSSLKPCNIELKINERLEQNETIISNQYNFYGNKKVYIEVKQIICSVAVLTIHQCELTLDENSKTDQNIKVILSVVPVFGVFLIIILGVIYLLHFTFQGKRYLAKCCRKSQSHLRKNEINNEEEYETEIPAVLLNKNDNQETDFKNDYQESDFQKDKQESSTDWDPGCKTEKENDIQETDFNNDYQESDFQKDKQESSTTDWDPGCKTKKEEDYQGSAAYDGGRDYMSRKLNVKFKSQTDDSKESNTLSLLNSNTAG